MAPSTSAPVNPSDLLAKAKAKTQAQVAAVVSSVSTGQPADSAGHTLYGLIKPYLLRDAGLEGQKLDEYLRAIIDSQVDQVLKVEVTIHHANSAELPTVTGIGATHKLFPLLLKLVSMRYGADHPKAGELVNRCVYLPGPAGSSKTFTAAQVARALGVEFFAMSVNGATTEGKILGFKNAATGDYVETDFYRAYRDGGLFLLDEVDAGTANALAVLNMAIEQDQVAFPCGMVQRHKDFYLMAAGNTMGYGADRVYVGRNELDGATLNRFTILDWPYDEGLEAFLAGHDGAKWLKRVQHVRSAVATLEIPKLITPRQTMKGAEMLRQGLAIEDVERITIRSVFSTDEWMQVEQAVGKD